MISSNTSMSYLCVSKSQQHCFLVIILFNNRHSQQFWPVMSGLWEVRYSKANLLHGIWSKDIIMATMERKRRKDSLLQKKPLTLTCWGLFFVYQVEGIPSWSLRQVKVVPHLSEGPAQTFGIADGLAWLNGEPLQNENASGNNNNNNNNNNNKSRFDSHFRPFSPKMSSNLPKNHFQVDTQPPHNCRSAQQQNDCPLDQNQP